MSDLINQMDVDRFMPEENASAVDQQAAAEAIASQLATAAVDAMSAAPPSFMLFMARRNGRAGRPDLAVRRALEQALSPEGFRLDIVDVADNPDLAKQSKVLATPTLVRRNPGPEVRLVGDVSDYEAIIERFQLAQS